MSRPTRMKESEKFEARQFREVGMSIEDLRTYFKVSRATMLRGLADMRAKFGPEKLPRAKRHLARCGSDTSPRATRDQP